MSAILSVIIGSAVKLTKVVKFVFFVVVKEVNDRLQSRFVILSDVSCEFLPGPGGMFVKEILDDVF